MRGKVFIFLLGLSTAFAVENNATTPNIGGDAAIQYVRVDQANGESFQFRQPTGRKQGGLPPMSGERHRQLFEKLRMRKMMNMLDLDKDQKRSLVDGYHQWRQNERMLQGSLSRLTSELARLVRGGGDDKELHVYTDSLRIVETRIHEARVAFLDQAEQLLTEAQMARLLVFQNRFEKKFFERLQRFRGRPAHPRGGFPDSIDERRRSH